jgi:histone-lysine N-methyltransferase SETD1
VIEYLGTVVRPSVADLLERSYEEEGIDCYLFHANDTIVIDSTRKGTYGRFTDHSCLPSMYSKVYN